MDEGLGGLLAGLGVMLIVFGGIIVLMIAGAWKINVKAGKPGWAAIVPIYSFMVLAEIGGKPSWWGLLPMIPFIGWIFFFIICIDVAKAFGKGAGFGICMVLFARVRFPQSKMFQPIKRFSN